MFPYNASFSYGTIPAAFPSLVCVCTVWFSNYLAPWHHFSYLPMIGLGRIVARWDRRSPRRSVDWLTVARANRSGVSISCKKKDDCKRSTWLDRMQALPSRTRVWFTHPLNCVLRHKIWYSIKANRWVVILIIEPVFSCGSGAIFP